MPIFNPLDHLKIRTKFFIFLIVPLTVVLFFSVVGIEQKYTQLENIQRTERFMSISLQLASIVHELQLERGLSAGYLGSQQTLFKTDLMQQRLASDAKIKAFTEKLDQINALPSEQNQASLFFSITHQLEDLANIRLAIDTNQADLFFTYYSKVNAIILTKIQSLLSVSADNIVNRHSTAYLSLLWLQEYMGQERGALNGVFTSQHMTASTLQDISAYARNQEASLRIFNIIGSTEQQNLLAKSLAQPINQVVVTMRHAAIDQAIRLDLLNQIQQLIGYTGLIHDFKNYVIRGDIFYFNRFLANFAQLQALLQKYRDLSGTSNRIFNHLTIIEQTFHQYEQKLALISKMKREGKSVSDIDNTVKIDDIPATNAFKQLRINISINTDQDWWASTTHRIAQVQQVSAYVLSDINKRIAQIKQELLQGINLYALLSGFTLLFIAIFSYFLLRRVAGEIILIARDLNKMRTSGNFDQLLKVTGDDEITEVEEAFNELITDRNKAEASLRLSDVVFHSSTEAIMISDPSNTIVQVNPAFNRVTGYSNAEVVGQPPKILQSGRQDQAFYQKMWQELLSKGHWEGEIWNRRKNGEVYLEWLIINIIQDAKGNVQHYISLFMDITQHKHYEESLWRHANYDILTELPNRKMLTETLKSHINHAQRENSTIAILFIDLDRFKLINDSFGLNAGDKLLKNSAQRLKTCIRTTDTVARLGNDQFVVLLKNPADIYKVEGVAQKVLQSLSVPLVLPNEQHINVTASIGIAMYPTDGNTPETLLSHANTAAYKAKEKGKNNFQFFTEDMNKNIAIYIELEQELRLAVEQNQLCLHYQPIYDAAQEQIIAAEALIRWPHATKGSIYPDQFIPLAEETGLIVPLGLWIIRQAWALAEKINHNSTHAIRLAVNISSRQCFDDGQEILSLLHDLHAQSDNITPFLDLEITESMLMDGNTNIIHFMQQVRELSIGIHLDDFGTGYSSLSYLRRFPVSKLKIDKSFIDGIISNEEDANLARSIIQLGHSMNIKTIAEGVETAEQLAFLKENSCDLIQGYYFSKPLPENEFLSLLDSKAG